MTDDLMSTQRHSEFVEKHRRAMKEVLGNCTEEVIRLQILATAPARQGRGYASQLVNIVTGIVSRTLRYMLQTLMTNAQADSQGRLTTLTSSNSANTGFYNFLGFVEKGRIVLGENNPSWKKEPIVLLVVSQTDSIFFRILA